MIKSTVKQPLCYKYIPQFSEATPGVVGPIYNQHSKTYVLWDNVNMA